MWWRQGAQGGDFEYVFPNTFPELCAKFQLYTIFFPVSVIIWLIPSYYYNSYEFWGNKFSYLRSNLGTSLWKIQEMARPVSQF